MALSDDRRIYSRPRDTLPYRALRWFIYVWPLITAAALLAWIILFPTSSPQAPTTSPQAPIVAALIALALAIWVWARDVQNRHETRVKDALKYIERFNDPKMVEVKAAAHVFWDKARLMDREGADKVIAFIKGCPALDKELVTNESESKSPATKTTSNEESITQEPDASITTEGSPAKNGASNSSATKSMSKEEYVKGLYSVYTYLNFMEELATVYRRKYIEQRVVRQYFAGVLDDVESTYSEFLERFRVMQPRSFPHLRLLLEEFIREDTNTPA